MFDILQYAYYNSTYYVGLYTWLRYSNKFQFVLVLQLHV